jgi:hypothetical protein
MGMSFTDLQFALETAGDTLTVDDATLRSDDVTSLLAAFFEGTLQVQLTEPAGPDQIKVGQRTLDAIVVAGTLTSRFLSLPNLAITARFFLVDDVPQVRMILTGLPEPWKLSSSFPSLVGRSADATELYQCVVQVDSLPPAALGADFDAMFAGEAVRDPASAKRGLTLTAQLRLASIETSLDDFVAVPEGLLAVHGPLEVVVAPDKAPRPRMLLSSSTHLADFSFQALTLKLDYQLAMAPVMADAGSPTQQIMQRLRTVLAFTRDTEHLELPLAITFAPNSLHETFILELDTRHTAISFAMLAANLPGGIGSLLPADPAFPAVDRLTRTDLRFELTGRPLALRAVQAGVELEGTGTWEIVPKLLIFESLRLDFTVIRAGGDWRVQPRVLGTCRVAGGRLSSVFDLSARTYFSTLEDGEKVDLKELFTETLGLAGLLPAHDTFDLTTFEIWGDAQRSMYTLDIGTTMKMPIDLYVAKPEIRSLFFSLEYVGSRFSGRVGGSLEIAGATAVIAAYYDGPSAQSTFAADLYDLRLTDLLEEILQDATISAKLPDVRFPHVGLTVTPATKAFRFAGVAEVAWANPFGVEGNFRCDVTLALARTGVRDQHQAAAVTSEITLEGDGTFKIIDKTLNAHLKVRVANDGSATRIDAALTTTIKISGIWSHEYEFQGALKFEANEIKGVLAFLTSEKTTEAEKKISNPFQLPGIEITALRLDLKKSLAEQAPPTVALLGHVRLGPRPSDAAHDSRPNVEVKLKLVGGKPALMSISLKQDFAVAKFIEQCFTGESRPKSFIELTFKDGSLIYYYDVTTEGDPSKSLERSDGFDQLLERIYKPGFNVDAHAELALGSSAIGLRFTFESKLDDRKNPAGFVAEGRATSPITLGCIQLAGKEKAKDADGKDVYAESPTLSIEATAAGNWQFGLDVGVNFFGRAIGRATVTVSRPAGGDTRLEATVSAIPVEGLGEFPLHITYARVDGKYALTVDNWPGFKFFEQLFGIVDKIKDLAEQARGSVCASVTRHGDPVVKLFTSFGVSSPSITAVAGDPEISLTLTCSMHLTDANGPVVMVWEPLPLKLVVPETTKLGHLVDAIGRGITDAAAEVVRKLLGQPHKVALFLAITFGERAAAYAFDLLCRQIEVSGKFAPMIAPAVPALTGTALAEIGGAALATGGVAGFVENLKEKLKDDTARAKVDDKLNQKLKDDPGREIHTTEQPNTKLEKPRVITFSFDGAAFTAECSGVAFAAENEFEITDGASFLRKKTAPATIVTFDDPAFARPGSSLAAANYAIRVRALSAEHPASDWSESEPKALLRLAKRDAPARPSLQFDGKDHLVATWARDKDLAYALELLHEERSLDKKPDQQGWAAAGLAPGKYTVRVAVRGAAPNYIASDWSAASDPVVKLAPPDAKTLTLRYDDGKDLVRLTWEWSGHAQGIAFDARLVPGDIHPSATSTTGIEFASALPVATYHATIKAYANSVLPSAIAPSDWSSPSERAIAKLPAPQNVSATLDAGAVPSVVVSVERSVADADAYYARLAYGADNYSSQVEIGVDKPATIKLRADDPGFIHVEARAAKRDGTAIASDWSRHAIGRFGSLTGIITCWYDRVEEKVMVRIPPQRGLGAIHFSYQIQFFSGVPLFSGTPPVETVPQWLPYGTSRTVAEPAEKAIEQSFGLTVIQQPPRLQVRVRRFVIDYPTMAPSPWSEAQPVLRVQPPPRPAKFEVEPDGDAIRVAPPPGNPSEQGERYSVRLTNAAGPATPIATGVIPQRSERIAIKDLAEGPYHLMGRRDAPDNNNHILPSAWTPLVERPIFKIATPVIASLVHLQDGTRMGRVIITLQESVAHVEIYEIQFVDDRASVWPASTASGSKVLDVSAEDIPPGRYTVRIKAKLPELSEIDRRHMLTMGSKWVASTETITLRPATRPAGYSLSLDRATGDCPVIPLGESIALRDFTMEAWLKTREERHTEVVYNCDGAFLVDVSEGAITLDMRAGEKTFYAKGYTEDALASRRSRGPDSPAPVDRNWHHIAVVRAGNAAKIYLDGKLLHTETGSTFADDVCCKERIAVGGFRPGASGNRFSGMLAELRFWKVARSEQEIQQAMRRTLDPREQNLLLYYNFAYGRNIELTGRGVPLRDGSANDLPIREGDGKIVPSDVPAMAPRAANSLLLDHGTGDYAEIPLSAEIDLGDFTMEAWIKTSARDAGRTVYNCAGVFNLTVTKGAIVFSGPSIHLSATAHIMDGRWHHVAIVRKGETPQIYVGGNLAPVIGPSPNLTGRVKCRGSIAIGSVKEHFTGMLAELRIWSVAREAQDIRQSMHGPLDPREPGLTLYYDFADGSPGELTGHGSSLRLHGDAKVVLSNVPVSARNGLSLNQLTHGIAVGPLSASIILREFTLEAWIKTSSTKHGMIVYAFGNELTFGVQSSEIGVGGLAPGIQGGGWVTANVVDGNWHHIAAVLGADLNLHIYVDGIEQLPLAYRKAKPSGPVTVGGSLNVGGFNAAATLTHFAGMLAELRIWDIARTEQDIARSMHRPLDPQQHPHLILYYNFADGSPRELTGRGLPLTLHGAQVVRTSVPVAMTHSLSLSSSIGALALMPLNASITLADFTVEAWIKTSPGHGGGHVYDFSGGLAVIVRKGSISVEGRNIGAFRTDADAVDGTWHHIAAVREGDKLLIYVDGELKPLPEWSGKPERHVTFGIITIGGFHPANTSSRFAGMLAELRIWDAARSAEGIRQSMNLTLDPDRHPHLILYYNFDDGSPRELTGRGVPLILQGGAEIVPSVVARKG